MATTSRLQAKMSTEAANNGGLPWSSIEAAVELLLSAVGGFGLPAYDSQSFTYYGSTNNIQTQVFKSGGTTVATLTYTYVGSGVADNDKIVSITKS